MKVSELVEYLKTLNQDAEVIMSKDDTQLFTMVQTPHLFSYRKQPFQPLFRRKSRVLRFYDLRGLHILQRSATYGSYARSFHHGQIEVLVLKLCLKFWIFGTGST